jgi:RHS repeat-associated protein
VGYTHAGGVDRPLVVWKGQGATPDTMVVPHLNWRGLFGKGTTENGYPTQAAIEWPGFSTTAQHAMSPTQLTTRNWWGSLLEGQRDAGGQMYMRNRYYDPATGQFTQTAPIGIAGGLNTYGFAGGDPVSYGDPYGLCPRVTVDGNNVLFEANLVFEGMNRGQQSAFTRGVQRFWAGSRFGYNVQFNMSVADAPEFRVQGVRGELSGTGSSLGPGGGGDIAVSLDGGSIMLQIQAGHEMGHGFGLRSDHHPDPRNLMHWQHNTLGAGTRMTKAQFEEALENCREDEEQTDAQDTDTSEDP